MPEGVLNCIIYCINAPSIKSSLRVPGYVAGLCSLSGYLQGAGGSCGQYHRWRWWNELWWSLFLAVHLTFLPYLGNRCLSCRSLGGKWLKQNQLESFLGLTDKHLERDIFSAAVTWEYVNQEGWVSKDFWFL